MIAKPTKRQRETRFVAMVFIMFLVFVMSACQPEKPITDVLNFPTRTATPTATPTCPPIVIETPDGLKPSPILVVALFDEDPYYSEYTLRAFDIVKNVLPQVIEPGDRFALFKLGVRSFEQACILYEKAQDQEIPAIPPTPTTYPTVTPTDTPLTTPPPGSFPAQVATVRAEGTTVALYATATQNAFEYGCAMGTWRQSYGQTSLNWEATKTAVREGASIQIQSKISAYQTQMVALPTEMTNDVYFGLANVTHVFANECQNFTRCVLLIFSDLVDWQRTRPYYLNIDLKNVEVVAVMLNCDVIYQPSCKNLQNLWTENFIFYGVHQNSITYKNGDDIENFLINFLRR